MPFIANIYRVFIASPGDVAAEREAIHQVINEWNTIHAIQHGLYLEAVRWESSSIPEMNDRPQAIINRQVVDECDVLVGVFWTRFGTPTGIADSGTVEEIERFIGAKKPVMLYFSDAPIPPSAVDFAQYAQLKEFKRKCAENGLIQSYADIPTLRKKLHDQLTLKLRTIPRNSLLSEDKGIYRTFSMWVGKLADDFILTQDALYILLKDGHTFFSTKAHLLRQRILDNKRSTRVLILHPDYKYMDAVADMDPRKRGFADKQRRDCVTAIETMHKIRSSIKSETGTDIATRVSFRGYKAVPTWCGFIGSTKAIIHLFPTMSYRSDLLTLEISAMTPNGNFSEFYEKYRTEYNEIERLIEGEGPDDSLSDYDAT